MTGPRPAGLERISHQESQATMPLPTLARTLLLTAGLSAAALGIGGCIIVAGNGGGSWQSSWASNTVTEERHMALPHVQDSPIDIRTQNGSIEIDRSGSNEVTFTATVRARTSERARQVEVHCDRNPEGICRIFVVWPEGKRKSDEGVSFVVHTPGSKGAVIETTNGEIRAEGLSGSVSLTTSNSSITARQIDGPVKAVASNGKITLRGVPSADARSSNGSIAVTLSERGTGPVNAETSNGSITLEVGDGFNGRVSARTSNGSVRNHVKRVNSGVANKDDSSFDFGAGEQSSLSTSNGSITIESR